MPGINIFEILEYGFFQRALIAGTLIAIIAPLIGMFLVVKRLSALSDTLAHASLIGVALAFLLNINPVNMAITLSVFAGLGIERLRNFNKMYGEAVLVLFLSGSLGLSSVIISLAGGFSGSLFGYLFGSINTVTWNDIWLTLLVSVLTIIFILIFFKQLFLSSLDYDLAVSQGVRVSILNTALVIFAAVIVSIGIQVVGVLLIGSLMVIPILAAMQYKTGFRSTILMAMLFSLFSVWLGLFMSFSLNVATGGTIVLINIFLFILALALNSLHFKPK